LQAQLQTLQAENDTLHGELVAANDAAKNNSEAEQKIHALEAELQNRNNKISGLQTESQNLNNALNNRKEQIEELKTQNADLKQQIVAFNTKVAEMESSTVSEDVMAEIRARLDAEVKNNAELSQKYQTSEEKLLNLQATIDETSENIDSIVAKLEKVLEENGTNNDNN